VQDVSELDVATLTQKVAEVEAEFRDAKEQEEFFTLKAQEQEQRRHQLIGRAGELNELIELLKAEDAEATEDPID
jgi:hypothetical protein